MVNPMVFKRDTEAKYEMSLMLEGIYKSGTNLTSKDEKTYSSLMDKNNIDVLEKEIDDMLRRAETIITD